MDNWPDDYHFKFTGIFGPIITSYLDPEEVEIIHDYCGVEKMGLRAVWAAAQYCVKNDLRDYLYFADQVPPHVIISEAAKTHNQYFVDSEIKRGVFKDFNSALVSSVATQDVKWITYFKDLGGTNYTDSLIAAMRINNKEIIKLIWVWEIMVTI